MTRTLAALAGLWLAGLAHAGDLAFGYVAQPGPGELPALLITPARDVASLRVVIDAGGERWDVSRPAPGGEVARFEFERQPGVTSATARVIARFADGHTEDVQVPFSWDYGVPLSVDLTTAWADLTDRTLHVQVTASVEQAEVKVFGARKRLLDERTVEVGAGPGEIAVPWVGDPSEAVLLDVTLRSGGSWAGFTYSPWFLDIPHEDVLFATNEAVIPPSEEPKLEATLRELREVLDKYGDVVPVQLYIAGCTDRVGDAASNQELSRRRAKAIASWLRAQGYDRPIFYYGFGESFLAVKTPDGVDEPRNRRALYMVGAAPPPPSSLVPQVSWWPL